MKRMLFLALCIVPCASCGESEQDVNPRTGTWGIAVSEPSNDTCGGLVDISTGDFMLTNNGDGTITIDPKDGTEVFNCTLDGDSLTCPHRLQGTYMQEGFAATLDVKVSASATFSSDTAATGEQDALVGCTGAGCTLAATMLGFSFPCEVTASFTASHKG